MAATAAAGISAASAAADSVAYIKGGDVYLTTPDGARQFQGTTGGGYDNVSQADDGTLPPPPRPTVTCVALIASAASSPISPPRLAITRAA